MHIEVQYNRVLLVSYPNLGSFVNCNLIFGGRIAFPPLPRCKDRNSQMPVVLRSIVLMITVPPSSTVMSRIFKNLNIECKISTGQLVHMKGIYLSIPPFIMAVTDILM